MAWNRAFGIPRDLTRTESVFESKGVSCRAESRAEDDGRVGSVGERAPDEIDHSGEWHVRRRRFVLHAFSDREAAITWSRSVVKQARQRAS